MDVFKTLLLDTPDSLNAITGTLQIANGGTGATDAAGARDNLLPDYTGNVGKVLTVNAGATDVEWTTNGAGTVTSVDVSGGTTGLTTSGGPVTSSGTITLAGTLAVANGGTGITSLGSGVATFLGTPSSANLAAAVTDETGTGALVFANSPTLVGPALGTPASGVVTNLTGTASININGTVGATTPTTGVFTALTVNDNSTLGSSNTDTVNFNARVASDINPSADDTYDLGVTGHEWRNLNIDGTANIDSLVADTADIDGGTIDATAIGATTPSTAVFTTLHQGTAGAQGLAVGFSGAAGQGFTLRDTTNSRTYFVTTETATGLQINAGANPISLIGSSVAVTGALSATGQFTGQTNFAIAASGNDYPSSGYNFTRTATSGVYNYTTTDLSSRLEFWNGGFRFFTAPSGTAGNAITFTERANITSTGLAVTGALSSTTGANFATSSGSVGVGTASPSGKLQVVANTASAGLEDGFSVSNAVDSNCFLQCSGSAATDKRSVIGPSTGTALAFQTGATERVRIDSTGNVGIGTTSPTYKLDVSVTTNNGIRTTSSAGQQSYLGNTGGEAVTGTLNNYGFGIVTNGSIRGYFDTSGNVGIGTTSPGAKLDVNGELRIGNTVNTVSPTSPNRTVTIVIGGTTYYLHAKTTND